VIKSSQNFFNENQYYITPSEIIEFLYCKRFIYFMKCLGIRQYEEKRYKVQKGREIHENHGAIKLCKIAPFLFFFHNVPYFKNKKNANIM
jgi:hypothetical protein